VRALTPLTRLHHLSRRPILRAALLSVAALLIGCTASGVPHPRAHPSPGGLPDIPVIAQGVSSANPDHMFRGWRWDFSTMRQVFNTVSLLPGDPRTVAAARRAGLAVVLEFDYKNEFFAGEDISAKVRRVAEQITAHPGTVAAIHVADRLNERYSAAAGLRYLAATGGVFHHLVPGIPVFVNASDWQLTCGLPRQASCASHGEQYQYETDTTLDAFRKSGYLDGLSIADDLKEFDATAQRIAWQRARSRWPAPFLLWATCSQLSFGAIRYTGSPPATEAVAAYMAAPMQAGADGVALWAWHQQYEDEVDTFLDKDGSPNPVWDAMRAAAAELTNQPIARRVGTGGH
jgi:hypothetical protein